MTSKKISLIVILLLLNITLAAEYIEPTYPLGSLGTFLQNVSRSKTPTIDIVTNIYLIK